MLKDSGSVVSYQEISKVATSGVSWQEIVQSLRFWCLLAGDCPKVPPLVILADNCPQLPPLVFFGRLYLCRRLFKVNASGVSWQKIV
jgi:hypothetical protein